MISTVITYYGQPLEIITKHLEAIYSSTVIPSEIIIVNDGHPTDLWTDIKDTPNLIYAKINEDIPWNPGGARNLGLWLSTGDLISMEDCDMYPLPEYYAKGQEALENADIFFTQPTEGCTNTSCCLMRRSVLVDSGGYDEDFSGRYGYEDVDLHQRLHDLRYVKNGDRLLYSNPDGGTNMERKWDENYKILVAKGVRPPKSVLRFTYSVKRNV